MSLILLLLACVEPGLDVSAGVPEVVEAPSSDPAPDPISGPVDEVDEVDEPADPAAERATRSGQLALGSADGRSWVADARGGAVLGFDSANASVFRLPLDGEPTRLVRSGTTLWVTLRATGELAELEEEGDGLRLVRRVAVGAEPYDVVVEQRSVYVSLSQEGAIVELDRVDLREVRRFPVRGEPRAMAVAQDPWTEAPVLAVMLERTPLLAVIDLEAGATTLHELPAARRTDLVGCDPGDLVPRVTGEVVWDRFADRLWLTGMYVDTDLSEAGDPADGVGPGLLNGCRPRSGSVYGGAPDENGISRFNPVVYVVDLVAGRLIPPQLLQGGPRGYPTTLELVGTVNPTLWVGFEAEERVASVAAAAIDLSTSAVDFGRMDVLSSLQIDAPSAARAEDPLDWRSSLVLWSRVRRLFREGIAARYASFDDVDPLVQRGLEAFALATNPRFSDPDSGVACASCHRDGRDDGLTWRFSDMARQTPSLAGPVSETAPLTWIGGVQTIAEEATLTTTLRMGGTGPSDEELAAVTAFVDAARRPAPRRPTASEQAARALGAEVFHRPEVGCAGCHSDANGAGAGVVSLMEIPALSIPPLVGIAATAPYLHNGWAATLEDVVERSREGVMGDTSSLSVAEADALVAYLRWFGEP